MGTRMQGRSALVTGAGNGVGKAIAKLLASEGAKVVVNDLGTDEFGVGRNSAAADETVAEITQAGGTAVPNYESIAEPEGCARAVQTAVESFGACDIVVGNAGAMLDSTIEASDENWRRLLDLYLGQKFWLTREALPSMLERGWGRVIFATSEIALGMQQMPLGATVLSGITGLSRDLANTHRGSGVTFNCYAPSAATRLFEVYRTEIEEGMRAAGIGQEGVPVLGPPPECVAPIVAWLCSDAAANVTGEVFGASGGTLRRWVQAHSQEALVKVGSDGSDVWSLDELDAYVPTHLMSGTG